ncbi:ada hat complex component 1 protein [Rutstroemia sp. NJR-2017a WRK4]|nr:ada hat complex component 1 protein [Rutstroemia sp. NJR-2017a WRK4]
MADANDSSYECTSPTKRKRSSSPNMPALNGSASQTLKRRKRDVMEGLLPLLDGDDMDAPDNKGKVLNSDLMRETIETQFSLEILMKHNELRLIEQELAKAQIALEQLRRVHLIPFPGTKSSPVSMSNVSNGTGPAVWTGDSVPKWAPPYGLTEGPYSRHHARWLIPDESFDGEHYVSHKGMEAPRAGKTVPEGRATRNSIADGSSFATKARTHRGSAGQKLHALSSGYGQPKGNSGPCILKRSDGQTVKLVCLDCHRENFSSTQGFINHCRIAHRREFKSHEEAAVTSGQPIEADDVGTTVVEEKSPSVATGHVHPLIRSAPTDRESYATLLSHLNESMDLYRQGKLPGVTSIPTSATTSPQKPSVKKAKVQSPKSSFVPSNITPHLSEFMRSKGFGGDLQEIVGDAKAPVDLDSVSSSDEEDSEDSEPANVQDAPVPQRRPGGFDGASDTPITGMRLPSRSTMSPGPFGRPTSSKGMDHNQANAMRGLNQIPSLPSYSPLNMENIAPETRPSGRLEPINVHRDSDGDVDMGLPIVPSIIDLSPNTVTSNNAPSLVSDDGEYNDSDDAAESVPSEDEDEGSDVAEIDIAEDGEGEKVVSRTVLGNRVGGGGEGNMRLKKEDSKHVTFVSPVKEGGNNANKKEKRGPRK